MVRGNGLSRVSRTKAGGLQARDARPILREIAPREFQMDQRRFELRSGEPILDSLGHAVEVQDARDAVAIGEQPSKRRRSSAVRASTERLRLPTEKHRGTVGQSVDFRGQRRHRLTHFHAAFT